MSRNFKSLFLLTILISCFGSATAEASSDGGQNLKPTESRVGVWGYTDDKSKWEIEPRFKVAYPFREDLAAVSCDGKKFAIINNSGFAVFNHVFPGVPKWCRKGLFVVQDADGNYGLYDKNGRRLKDDKFHRLDAFHGVIVGQRKANDPFRFLDGNLQPLNSTAYSELEIVPVYFRKKMSFKHQAIFRARTFDGRTLFVDGNGNDLFSGRFTDITPLTTGTSVARQVSDMLRNNGISEGSENCIFYAIPAGKKKYGVYTIGGTELMAPTQKSIDKIEKNFLKELGKKLASRLTSGELASQLCDESNKLQATLLEGGESNLAALGIDKDEPAEVFEFYEKTYGLMKAESTVSAENATTNKTATVTSKNKKKGKSKQGRGKNSNTAKKETAKFYFKGLVNNQRYGNETFVEMTEVMGAVVVCRRPGHKKYELYGPFGEKICDKEFDHIEYAMKSDQDDVLLKFRVGNKWGLTNMFGDILLQPEYDDLSQISYGDVAGVKKSNKYYLMNTKTFKLLNNNAYDEVVAWNRQKQSIMVERMGYTMRVGLDGKESPTPAETEYAIAKATFGDLKDKVDAFVKALSLCSANERNLIGECYNDIGCLYYNENDYDNAGYYFNLAQKYDNKYAANNIQVTKNAVAKMKQSEERLSDYASANRNSGGSSRRSGKSAGASVKTWREELGYGGYVEVKEYPNGLVQRTRWRLCINCRGSLMCASCYGTGRCSICQGRGGIVSAGYGNYYACYSCSSSGACRLCSGSGRCGCTLTENPGYCVGSLTAMTKQGDIIFRDDADYSTSSSRSESSSTSSNSSSSRSTSKKECPGCHGKRLWLMGKEPEYSRPISQLIGYYNPLAEKCPHCGHLTEHWHSRCATCRHDGQENPYR